MDTETLRTVKVLILISFLMVIGIPKSIDILQFVMPAESPVMSSESAVMPAESIVIMMAFGTMGFNMIYYGFVPDSACFKRPQIIKKARWH